MRKSRLGYVVNCHAVVTAKFGDPKINNASTDQFQARVSLVYSVRGNFQCYRYQEMITSFKKRREEGGDGQPLASNQEASAVFPFLRSQGHPCLATWKICSVERRGARAGRGEVWRAPQWKWISAFSSFAILSVLEF